MREVGEAHDSCRDTGGRVYPARSHCRHPYGELRFADAFEMLRPVGPVHCIPLHVHRGFYIVAGLRDVARILLDEVLIAAVQKVDVRIDDGQGRFESRLVRSPRQPLLIGTASRIGRFHGVASARSSSRRSSWRPSSQSSFTLAAPTSARCRLASFARKSANSCGLSPIAK